MKYKKLFVSLTAVFSVIIFLAIFLMIWFFGDNYKDFESFRKEFEIAGLDDGAVPQGIGTCAANYNVEEKDENGETKTVIKTQQYFFTSAYMKDGSPSRIYVTGEKTGYVGFVTLKDELGRNFYGHCGGVAINNNTSVSSVSSAKNYTLWVTGDNNNIYVAKSSEAYREAKKTIAQEIVEKAAGIPLTSSEGEVTSDNSISFTTQFEANCKASFLFYYDDPTNLTGYATDRLYVGEFYREGNYETDKKHWLTTPSGYQNTAFMYEYNVSTSTDYGLTTLSDAEQAVPKVQKIFSLPEQIQGAAFTERTGSSTYSTSTLILSQSYGLANSHLLCFDFEKVTANANRSSYKTVTGENFAYNGVTRKAGNSSIPYTDNTSSLYVYYVDKADKEMFIRDYSIPCMSECMCVVAPSSRVYVLFESASKKYNMFVRQQLKNVYSFTPKI